MRLGTRWWWLALVAVLVTACSSASGGDLKERLPRGTMPSFARERGPDVEALYRYALENQKTLQYIPCYCGCKNIGHKSNRDCYIVENHPDGTVTYTSHAAT